MKSVQFLIAAALAGATVAVGSPSANAGTLFSDIGPANSYNVSTGWSVGDGYTPANSFVASAGGRVSEIDIALASIGGGDATVSLWTDVGGALGAELGSWSISGFPAFGTAGPLSKVTGITGINLTAGDSYFLQVSTPGVDAWNWNSQGVTGDLLENGAPNGSNTSGAFQLLSGAAVPEPATWAMLILGVAMIGAAARRRGAGLRGEGLAIAA